MNTPTDEIKQSLLTILESLDKQIQEHREQLAVIAAKRKTIAASLAPLTRESNAHAGKPAPRKAEVVEAVTAVLKTRSPVTRDELEKAAAERIRQTHSLAGFALRFGEVLDSDRVVEDERGVRLKAASDANLPTINNET